MDENPRGFAHVGITVPDMEEAIRWYQTVLDWELIKGPSTSRGNEGHGGRRAVNLLGEFEEMKVAQLTTGNQIGIELFEFDETTGVSNTNPKAPGLFHICVIDPDVEGLAEKIAEHGGSHEAKIWSLYEGDDTYELTYCTDPYGNIIEIYSHSHELMHGNAPPKK